ncbi:hypothetical protein [Streptomyces sp. NPDC052107]|uniref:hypothetical protein n=1 Tax=Streptomyces sp. NPDC052107 TaxID=3155632 RepID=UPI0034384874
MDSAELRGTGEPTAAPVGSNPNNGLDPALDSEDIRAGYIAAIQMVVYDGQLSWQVTGIYVQFAFVLIAGAIFPSFIKTTNSALLALSGMAIALCGIIITAMFWSMVSRIRTYEGYWVVQAAALERMLDRRVTTIAGSMQLSTRRLVRVGDEHVRMRRAASAKSKHVLSAFLAAFLFTFFGLFALNIGRLIKAL